MQGRSWLKDGVCWVVWVGHPGTVERGSSQPALEQFFNLEGASAADGK
jgi:hypothetical protein